MTPARRVGAVLVTGAVAFAAVTIYALEGQEVVVLRTRTPDGEIRGTRTWVVDDGAAVLIEAAFPERPFLQDLLRNPEVDLNRHHEVRRYRAAPLENPDGHVRIRALLRDLGHNSRRTCASVACRDLRQIARKQAGNGAAGVAVLLRAWDQQAPVRRAGPRPSSRSMSSRARTSAPP